MIGKITFCSKCWDTYQFYFLEVFSDLAQPHGRVGKYLGFLDLLVQNLCKYHLESHGYSRLLQILFEHFCLLLPFRGLVHPLSYPHCTSLIYYSSSGSGLASFGGATGSGYGFLGDSALGSSFLGSGFFAG